MRNYKQEIKERCIFFNVELPDFNNIKSINDVIDKTNNTCVFCKEYKGNTSDVICLCEVNL